MSEPNNQLISQIIENISMNKNVFIKSQQKDETDLTLDQKREIVSNLFNDNKELFIQRYGNYLSEEELNYFDVFEDNYVIKSVLKGLRNGLNKNKNKSIVRNRRFQRLQELLKSGHYFSDSQMQTRNPLLFHQMIGQYMTEEEKTKLTNERLLQNHQNITFSAFLLDQMDRKDINDRMDEQEVEEFDSDSDSEDNESEVIENKCLSDSEKQKSREEFIGLMSEDFISGKDYQFYDYKQCDYDSDLDYNSINEREEEDRYFDADD